MAVEYIPEALAFEPIAAVSKFAASAFEPTAVARSAVAFAAIPAANARVAVAPSLMATFGVSHHR